MALTQLSPRAVEKPWGRRSLPAPFETFSCDNMPIGEIVFDPPPGTDPELLIKFLFTEQKLSIQVHPDDRKAHAKGVRRGKDEAWVVLEAEPGAEIGLGLKHAVSPTDLLTASATGKVEALVDWHPVVAGDCLYSPAGTIHAIGAGLSLLEIQQNCDLTYRLYDYGRPREIQPEEAVDAARLTPALPNEPPLGISESRTSVARGSALQVERLAGPVQRTFRPSQAGVWLIPLVSGSVASGQSLEPGEVWHLDDERDLSVGRAAVLIVAYPNSQGGPVWHDDDQ